MLFSGAESTSLSFNESKQCVKLQKLPFLLQFRSVDMVSNLLRAFQVTNNLRFYQIIMMVPEIMIRWVTQDLQKIIKVEVGYGALSRVGNCEISALILEAIKAYSVDTKIIGNRNCSLKSEIYCLEKCPNFFATAFHPAFRYPSACGQ